VTAARVAGIDAIDAPYPAYQDPEGYRRSAVHASLLGFDGKWAIHPSQIDIANEVFAPTAAEVAEARESIEIYRKSETDGLSTPRTCASPRTRSTRPRSPPATPQAVSRDPPCRPTPTAAAGGRFRP
jgi:hypothetical protein